MSNTKKRFAAGLSALAVTLGSFGLGTAASADAGTVGPDQPDAPKDGSLTIHKLVGNQGSAGDGTELEASGKPLADVEFTIWQLGESSGGTCTAIDLKDSAAWDGIPTGSAPSTSGAVSDDGYCLVDAGTAKATNAAGELTFDDLDLGLYYVQETKAPSEVVSKSAPFYVTVPLPHSDGSWIYDVHAYPKNKVVDAPTKTINSDAEQGGLVVGSTVEYTIDQTVPALNAGEKYESASIWDVLPEGLAYAGTSSVTLNDAALDAADYTIDPNGVTWTLTDTGLAKLKAGETLQVVFTATVTKVTENGVIANPGSDGNEPGYGSEFNGGKVPGETTPYTYWGQLKVTKVDQNEKTLAGAEFKVTAKGSGACADTLGNQTVISAGKSGSDGVVLWEATEPASSPLGLFVANSDTALTNPTKAYCLYETKAPAGYTGAGVETVTVSAGTTATTNVTVKNTQTDGPDLPLTGAQGTLLMVIGGLVLVAVGTGAVVTTRKRQAAQG